MKSIVVYSSVTGNTKMVAEAIAEELGAEQAVFPVDQAPIDVACDLIAVGFWVNRGSADIKTAKYLEQLKNKNVALFATLGAYPDSQHAIDSIKNAAQILDESNTVVGSFICQGKVNPKLVEKMAEKFPKGHSHEITAERRERHKAASTHPDENDLMNAKKEFGVIKETIEEMLGTYKE